LKKSTSFWLKGLSSLDNIHWSVSLEIVDPDKNDVESLIQIYSSPDLYHNREEASWFVRSFLDYHHVKIVRHERNVVGAVFWNVVEEKHHGLVEIGDLWIDKDFRRRGLGQQLLRTVIEDMKKIFTNDKYVLRKVLVTTGEDNEPAKKLYEKAGFRKSAVLRDLFRQGENELVYVLTVNP
jgi:ribosomal protein S18 acetylase RimI-like enzyme